MTLLASSSMMMFVLLPAAVVVVLGGTTTTASEAPVCDPARGRCGSGSSSSRQVEQQEEDYSTTLSSSSESSATVTKTKTTPPPPPPTSCGLYLAESLARPGQLSLFKGNDYDVERRQQQQSAGTADDHNKKNQLLIGPSEILIPMIDPNKNEWTAWHDYAWDTTDSLIPGALHENRYLSNLFVSGVGPLTMCADHSDQGVYRPNIKTVNADVNDPSIRPVDVDSAGVHRSTHPSAGSFSYYHNFAHEALYPLKAGEELFMDCDGSYDGEDENVNEDPAADGQRQPRSISSIEHLQETGLCVDTLSVRTSTIPGAGRGAFANRAFEKGQVVASSHMLHLDRSQTEILEQGIKTSKVQLPLRPEHEIDYTETVKRRQLLLNYCFGHKDSHVLLYPLGPAANMINHAVTAGDNNADAAGDGIKTANVRMRWSTGPLADNVPFLGLTAHELFDKPAFSDGALLVDYVATRDIAEGEEILLDYGEDWQRAWDEHVEKWRQNNDSGAAAVAAKDYVSAADYLRQHPEEPIRTLREQESDPYPTNLRTTCYFQNYYDDDAAEGDDDDESSLEWHPDNFACLRPCQIVDRWQGKDDGGKNLTTYYYYKAVVFPLDRLADEPYNYCGGVPVEGLTVTKIPSKAVTLMDKPYTTDMHLPKAFRHAIGVPSDDDDNDEFFFPDRWMAPDPNPSGDFIPSPLSPGQLEQIRWKNDPDNIVTKYAYRIGLDKRIREVLLEYCDKMGITETFRHVTYRGNALPKGTNLDIKLNDGKDHWILQRPVATLPSNIHWISPGDNDSHEHYLQALSVAGWDKYIDAIGKHLGMESLVAFHVTFLAVSHSYRGYMHHDMQKTGGKTYNVIIPLMLANETDATAGPELDLHDDDYYHMKNPIGRYRYEYDVGMMIGDSAYHATSAADYRNSKQMRMAATVYLADVNRANVKSIVDCYTNVYPPKEVPLLWSWRGRHWNPNDPTAKLPEPAEDHILLMQK